MKSFRATLFIIVLMTLCGIGFSASGTIAQGASPAIDSPTSGQTIGGPTLVSGSAVHPDGTTAYQLWFALTGTAQWFAITDVQPSPSDGVFSVTWETAGLPAGIYDIRLQVFLADGSSIEAIVAGLNLEETNAPAAPTALPPGEPAQAPPTLPNEPASLPQPDTGSQAFLIGAGISTILFAMGFIYHRLRKRLRPKLRKLLVTMQDDA